MPGVRMAQAFWVDESTPGTVIAVAGASALRLPRPAPPPGKQGSPIDRELTHANADFGESKPAVARHYSGTLPPLHISYWDESATRPEHGAILKAMGYSETINVGVDATYDVQAAPNATATSAAGSLYLQEAPAGDGHQYIVFGTRARGTFRFGGGQPHMLEVEYQGGFGGSGRADLGALTNPTYYTDEIACTINTFSLFDGTTTWDSVLILREGLIRSPFTPAPRASGGDASGEGFALPPYMTPGRIEAELTIELVDQAVFPLQAIMDDQRQLTLTVGYSDGAGPDTITHTVRGLNIMTDEDDPGPPATVRLTMLGSSVGANSSHTIAYA